MRLANSQLVKETQLSPASFDSVDLLASQFVLSETLDGRLVYDLTREPVESDIRE